MAQRDTASQQSSPADAPSNAVLTHNSNDVVSFNSKRTPLRMYKQAVMCILEFLPLAQQRLLTGVSREWRAAADSSTVGKAWRQISRLGFTAAEDFSGTVARMNTVRRANDSQRRQQLLAGWQRRLREAGCLTAGQPLLQMLQSTVVTRTSLSNWGSTGSATLTVHPPAIGSASMSATAPERSGTGTSAATASTSDSTRPPPVQWYLHWSYESATVWQTRDLRWCVSPSAAPMRAGANDAALLVVLYKYTSDSRPQWYDMCCSALLMAQLLLRWGVLCGDKQQQVTLLRLCLEALHELACFESLQFDVLDELLDSFDDEEDWLSAAVVGLQQNDEHEGKAQHIADLDNDSEEESSSGDRKRQRCH